MQYFWLCEKFHSVVVGGAKTPASRVKSRKYSCYKRLQNSSALQSNYTSHNKPSLNSQSHPKFSTLEEALGCSLPFLHLHVRHPNPLPSPSSSHRSTSMSRIVLPPIFHEGNLTLHSPLSTPNHRKKNPQLLRNSCLSFSTVPLAHEIHE